MSFNKVSNVAIFAIATTFIGPSSFDSLEMSEDEEKEYMATLYQRVNEEDFKKEYPEHGQVDFTGFGLLVIEDQGWLYDCSVEYFENLIATAKHCFDDKSSDATASVTFWDLDGMWHEIPLDIHRNGYFNNVFAPSVAYLDPKYNDEQFVELIKNKADDIAFIPVEEGQIPKKIKPLKIKSIFDRHIREVFAAGYSPLVRIPDDENDSGLSLSEECFAKPADDLRILSSSCVIADGDSGGGIFTIDGGDVHIAAINTNAYNVTAYGENDSLHYALINHRIYNIEPVTGILGLSHGNLLAQYGEFCRREIGEKYCTAFPSAENGGIPHGTKPDDYIDGISYRENLFLSKFSL